MKLTERLGEEFKIVDPLTCSLCGESKHLCGNPPMYQFALLPWDVCDERDIETGEYVVLCRICSHGKFIDDHPVLFSLVDYQLKQVAPGAMPQCQTCKFRAQLTCQHPSRWASGLMFAEPVRVRDTGIEWSSNPKVLNTNSPFDFAQCQSRLGIQSTPKEQTPDE